MFHPRQDGLVPRCRWDFKNMKNDHQDSRIPDQLLIGKKLEGSSKINSRTTTGVDKIRLQQFALEKNGKNFVKYLLTITLWCVGWCGWESYLKMNG